MAGTQRSCRSYAGAVRLVGNLGLAVVLAVVVAGTAVAIAASWGGAYVLPGGAAGTVTGAAALLRRRVGRVRAAVLGLAVATAALVATLLPAQAAALAGAQVTELPAGASVEVWLLDDAL